MEYLSKHPKLIQIGIVLFGFVVLVLMTGQYSEIIDSRDGFIKAVERGEITPVTGFSESISMILSGQLPPQFVRIPELNFLNPVVNNSIAYIFISFLIGVGLIFNNFNILNKLTQLSIFDWFKNNWTKLFLYAPISIFVGLFIAPSLVSWFFGEPESTSFWELPRVVTEFANFLMYEWFPIQIYDPDIEEFEDSALIFEITRGISASLLFAIDLVREVLLGGVKTIVAFTSWDFVGENKWAVWPALPWTVVPLFFYTFGTSIIGPGATLLALDLFPHIRGTVASCQSFAVTLMGAIVSGLISPLLSHSVLWLAIGQALFALLALGLWIASRVYKRAMLARGG